MSYYIMQYFRLFVILSLTQLYRYTPEIFLFSTATFKYTYRAPLRRIGQEYSANVAFSIMFASPQELEKVIIPSCPGLPVPPPMFQCILDDHVKPGVWCLHSKLIRYARVCVQYSDFLERGQLLSEKLLRDKSKLG
jgi:hypothetical protein